MKNTNGMKVLKFDSVLPRGLKHEHETDFSGRE